MSNAFSIVRQNRIKQATKPFNARGKKTIRCEDCQVSVLHCICAHRPKPTSQFASALLMHRNEILKPSNTGKLIADIVENTSVFLWQRNEPDKALLTLINDNNYQPLLIFPLTHAVEEQPRFDSEKVSEKVPLFIFIDATWRDARRIYHKSPYLHDIPILSLKQTIHSFESQYARQPEKKGQFSTAEAAASAFDLLGFKYEAQLTQAWYDVFNFAYQQGKTQENKGNANALDNLLALKKSPRLKG